MALIAAWKMHFKQRIRFSFKVALSEFVFFTSPFTWGLFSSLAVLIYLAGLPKLSSFFSTLLINIGETVFLEKVFCIIRSINWLQQ